MLETKRVDPMPAPAGGRRPGPIVMALALLAALAAGCGRPTPEPPRFPLAPATVAAGSPTALALTELRIAGAFRGLQPAGWPPAPLPLAGFDTALLFVDPGTAGMPGSELRFALVYDEPAGASKGEPTEPTREDLRRLGSSELVAPEALASGEPAPARLAGLPALSQELEDDGRAANGGLIRPPRRSLLIVTRDPSGRLLGLVFEAERARWEALAELRRALVEGLAFEGGS